MVRKNDPYNLGGNLGEVRGLTSEDKKMLITAINSDGRSALIADKKSLPWFKIKYTKNCLNKLSRASRKKPTYNKKVESLKKKILKYQ